MLYVKYRKSHDAETYKDSHRLRMSIKYEFCTYFIAQRGILLVNNLVLIDFRYSMTFINTFIT